MWLSFQGDGELIEAKIVHVPCADCGESHLRLLLVDEEEDECNPLDPFRFSLSWWFESSTDAEWDELKSSGFWAAVEAEYQSVREAYPPDPIPAGYRNRTEEEAQSGAVFESVHDQRADHAQPAAGA